MQLKQLFHIRVLIVIAILVKSSSYYVPKAVGAVSTLSQSTADKNFIVLLLHAMD